MPLPAVTAADFMPADLPPVTPLSLPGMVGSLPGPSPGAMPGITALNSTLPPCNEPINSITSSIVSNLPPSDRSSSRNSYSPAMSDSGISVDTGSTSSNNSGLVNLNALAKLGTISVNAQGEKIIHFYRGGPIFCTGFSIIFGERI